MTGHVSPPELAVVIGRFQPFHRGHAAVLGDALEAAPRVLVVVGSAGSPRLVKNPFSADERIRTIRATLAPEQRARVAFTTVPDYYDEPRWAEAVQAAVAREGARAPLLVGFRKDESSSQSHPRVHGVGARVAKGPPNCVGPVLAPPPVHGSTFGRILVRTRPLGLRTLRRHVLSIGSQVRHPVLRGTRRPGATRSATPGRGRRPPARAAGQVTAKPEKMVSRRLSR